MLSVKLYQNTIQKNMFFKQKFSDRSVENTSSADDRTLKNEGEMSFVLICKYFGKKVDKQNKRMEWKLHSDARKIEKKWKLSKPEQEIDFNFQGNEMQHVKLFNVKLVKELENISFLVSKGSVSRVKKKIYKLVEEVQRRNKLMELADRSHAGWATVQEYLFNNLASDSEDEKWMRAAESKALAKREE